MNTVEFIIPTIFLIQIVVLINEDDAVEFTLYEDEDLQSCKEICGTSERFLLVDGSGCLSFSGYYYDRVSSINIDGDCIEIWDQFKCLGRSIKLYPRSENKICPENNLRKCQVSSMETWDDRLRSAARCDYNGAMQIDSRPNLSSDISLENNLSTGPTYSNFTCPSSSWIQAVRPRRKEDRDQSYDTSFHCYSPDGAETVLLHMPDILMSELVDCQPVPLNYFHFNAMSSEHLTAIGYCVNDNQENVTACPPMSAVCGILLEYSGPNGNLIRADQICCPIINPLDACKPRDRYELIKVCDNRDNSRIVDCEYSMRTGIFNNMSDTEKAFYEAFYNITDLDYVGKVLFEKFLKILTEPHNGNENASRITHYDWFMNFESPKFPIQPNAYYHLKTNQHVKPHSLLRIEQAIGTCGFFTVRTELTRSFEPENININRVVENPSLVSPTKPPVVVVKDLRWLSVSIAGIELFIISVITILYLWSKQIKQFGKTNSSEIEKEQLLIGTEIGHGQHGIVYKGSIKMPDGEVHFVAVKTPNTLSSNDQSLEYFSALETLRKERVVLEHVGLHPNIVHLIAANTEDLNQRIFLAVDYCENGDLLHYLRQNHALPLSESETQKSVNWCYEIANGMEYLCSKNVLHNDLAARNILLTKDLTTKITDFGLSRKLKESIGQNHPNPYYRKCPNSQDALPWEWMAPESFTDFIFDEKTDVWSYGIVIWEIFTTCIMSPYQGYKLESLTGFAQLLRYGKRPLLQPIQSMPDYLMETMKCSWNTDPKERPYFKEILLKFPFHHDECEKRKPEVDNVLLQMKRKYVPVEVMGLMD